MKKTLIYQDNFYKNIESNLFFQRNYINKFSESFKYENIRNYKIEIYNLIKRNFKISNKSRVLEIGCLVGDLLKYFKLKNKCKIYGIEPSSNACEISKKLFKIRLENCTFFQSKLFNLNNKNLKRFDIIILDDVLSWIDRDILLPTIGIIDWLLADNGIIFIRDFSPNKKFAHPNHHHIKKKIFNFKNKNGHKEFFYNSGKYIEIYNRNYYSSKMQKIFIRNKESMKWSDTIIKKTKNFTHPIIHIGNKTSKC